MKVRVQVRPELTKMRRINRFHKHIVHLILREANTTHGATLNRQQNGHVHSFLLKTSTFCYKEHLVTRMKDSTDHHTKGLPKRDTGWKATPKGGLYVSTGTLVTAHWDCKSRPLRHGSPTRLSPDPLTHSSLRPVKREKRREGEDWKKEEGATQ